MKYIPENKIDHRKIDLNDARTVSGLNVMFKEWWQDVLNSRQNSGIEDIWARNILYYEGYQTPVGFTNNYLREFIKKNYDKIDPTNILKKDEKGLIYVIDNKLQDMVDAVIGEYTNIEKKASVLKDDSVKNNGIEKAVQNLYERYERKNDLWNTVTIPCIEDMILFGLAWDKVRYNPFRNPQQGGDIDFRDIDPRNVFPDPASKKKYFSDANFIIHREPMELEIAKEFLSKFPKADISKVVADSEFTLSNKVQTDDISIARNNNYVDVLFIEYKKTYTDDIQKKQEFQQEEISTGQIQEERDYYFYAIYTQSTGIVHHELNQNTWSNDNYFKYYLTPYFNKKSRVRVYPQSDIEKLANIQDIINISKTLILDSARKRNIIRAFVKDKIYNEYPDLVEQFLEMGGLFPVPGDEDMRTQVLPISLPDLPKEIYEFMAMAEKSFESQSDSESALRGDYPNSGVPSGKAIENLVSQKRKKLSNKDVNINWAVTQRAKKMYTIFAFNFDEEMYLRLMDSKKNDPKITILNGIRTFPEYIELLIEAGLVDEQTQQNLQMIPQTDPDYFSKIQQLIEQASDKFSETNEVEFFHSEVGIDGQRLPAFHVYQTATCFINHLSKDDRLDIKISLNYDSERQKTEEKVIATNMWQNGRFPDDMYLELLGGFFADNKDEIITKMDAKSREMMIAKEIEERGPEFAQAIAQLMQEFDQKKQAEIVGRNPQKQNLQQNSNQNQTVQ